MGGNHHLRTPHSKKDLQASQRIAVRRQFFPSGKQEYPEAVISGHPVEPNGLFNAPGMPQGSGHSTLIFGGTQTVASLREI